MKREIYLENTPLGEALERWFSLCGSEGVEFPLESETVDVRGSLGRVTSGPIFAKISSPPFHSSAMDGVAVLASETYGANEAEPVRLRLGQDVELIDTGEPLPEGFDAVIMVEDLDEIEEGVYEIIKPATPWQHVRSLGEDIVKTDLILPRGHRIRPEDIGALLNSGWEEIPVVRRPRVAIVPTGTELVEHSWQMKPGKVMESNSWVLGALVEEAGGEASRMDLVPDDYETIKSSLEGALGEADAVVINAGTSAGREDYTRSLMEELGRVVVHGVAMKPGKPVVLGAARGKPVIGLPGFPVANYRGAEEFLLPLVKALLGLSVHRGAIVGAKLARKIFSTSGFDEFVQVKLGRVDDTMVAVPLPRGSGVSMSLVRSDGFIKIPAASEGMGRWDEAEVTLRDRDIYVDGTILATGSHDVALDLLADHLKQRDPLLTLASVNVGSMGGIMAIKTRQTHLAGTHLLDPDSGEFNIPYIREHLSPEEALILHLAWRTQGLMVLTGNPKGIKGIDDLTRDDVSFINRQKGSGTRLLLDHLLGEAGVDPASVHGYGREVFTHTAVAAAVAGGAADTGLGVLAAARALDMEFIPVSRERYDLVVLRSFAGTRGFGVLRKVLADPAFREEVEGLGGYDLSGSGEIVELEGE